MKKIVSIIGGGPSGLMVAAMLDKAKYQVTIYEKNKALGRKFLVAGKGGFNLTHGEAMEDFIHKYTPSDFLLPALLHFGNKELREWLEKIGIPTYVGSSHRVFPIKGIKPIQVLQSIVNHLEKEGVQIKTKYKWSGWTDQDQLCFNENETVVSDYTIFCLGGQSWKVTGSDGLWLSYMKSKGIKTLAFQPSNCAYQVAWPERFLKTHSGKPLKNISVKSNEISVKGELVITDFGLEGNAIYALSPAIRTQLEKQSKAQIYIDLKPSLTRETIHHRLSISKEKNRTQALSNTLNLSTTKVQLIKALTTKEEFQSIDTLSKLIKGIPITFLAAAPIDEAISTTGGISIDAISKDYELKALPNHYCIGEMIDWDAPTGGYLLQACISQGAFLAAHLNRQ